jgi:hypothetical protein
VAAQAQNTPKTLIVQMPEQEWNIGGPAKLSREHRQAYTAARGIGTCREHIMERDPKSTTSNKALQCNNINTNIPQTITQPHNTVKTFAASSATEAEEKITKLGKHPDGSIPVKVPKRIWRPQVHARNE